MRWIRALQSTYGAPFLSLITLIYWTQGFRSFAWMGISYQMKDKLRLSPSASQFVVSTAFIPWSIKPIYGILSDCVPIRGNRRVPYLVISSILSFLPWIALARMAPLRSSYVYLTVLLTTQNVGAAMADVVVDAMVAETARKERAESAGDLQAMSWFAMAFGGIIGSISGGLGLAVLNVEGIFLLFSIFPLLQLLACGMIDEKTLGQVAMAIDEGSYDVLDNDNGDGLKFEVLETAYTGTDYYGMLSIDSEEDDFLNTINLKAFTVDKQIYDSVGIATLRLPWLGPEESDKALDTQAEEGHEHDSEDDEDWIQIGENGLEKEEPSLKTSSPVINVNTQDNSTSNASGSSLEKLDLFEVDGLQNGREFTTEEAALELENLVIFERQQRGFRQELKSTFVALLDAVKQPAIMQPMLWFMISQVAVPNLSTIMFYYQTNHLHLESSFLGTSRVIGWGGLMLGTFLFNNYLKHVPLRKIFWWVHVGVALLTLTDIILVLGLNSQMGIPDKAFVLGASALGDAVSQFKFMPFLVLSGHLCPPGIEGTLFALFMSVNNLGATVSSFTGAALASALNISSESFDNLALGIVIQAVCTLIPIFFLFLIPAKATGASHKGGEHVD